MKRRLALLSLLLGASAVVPACTSSGTEAHPVDAALPVCGASEDCTVHGQVCAYQAVHNGCSLVGHCQTVVIPADVSKCSPAALACDCSNETFMIPACWGSLSPVAILDLGPCPVPVIDAGDGGIVDAGDTG
jgi:hypothetical protein